MTQEAEISQSRFTLPIAILYEDDDLIAVNKPANMLSVPGNTSVEKRSPRQTEWLSSISHAAAAASIDDDACTSSARAILQLFADNGKGNVPRKEKQFKSYIQRNHRTISAAIGGDFTSCSESLLARLWDMVSEADDSLYRKAYEHCRKRMYVVHRLDQATSGVLLFAKSQPVAGHLSKQFREHNSDRVRKRYLAELLGAYSYHAGMQDFPNVTAAPARTDHAKQSITWARVVSRSEVDCIIEGKVQKVPTTVMDLLPITGRTHQLRIHCACLLKHPILGDDLYSNSLGHTARVDRLALHAYSLSVEHPTTGRKLNLIAPITLQNGLNITDGYAAFSRDGGQLVSERPLEEHKKRKFHDLE
eukprot:GSChrysophyteH1.ASY1.ANO1.2509.1 assembled CDS